MLRKEKSSVIQLRGLQKKNQEVPEIKSRRFQASIQNVPEMKLKGSRVSICVL
jgi:hypothetical protein